MPEKSRIDTSPFVLLPAARQSVAFERRWRRDRRQDREQDQIPLHIHASPSFMAANRLQSYTQTGPRGLYFLTLAAEYLGEYPNRSKTTLVLGCPVCAGRR
jgi:hypothetical protein